MIQRLRSSPRRHGACVLGAGKEQLMQRQRVHPMKHIPLLICAAAVLFGSCGCNPGQSALCESGSLKGLFATAILSEDPETMEMKQDAEALRRVLDNPSVGGGPSSPENRARFARFRDFMIRKCHRYIGSSLMKPAAGFN